MARLIGQVLDENYTQLLLASTELDLLDVIALDRVQKKFSLDEDVFARLKTNLLQAMKLDGQIEPHGVTRWATWRLSNERRKDDN